MTESLEQQYATDANLRARIALHQRFSTATEDWHRWVFHRIAPPSGARLLEVGCGPAELWKQNLDRIDPSWRLTLADRSAGMVDAAREVLGDRAVYAVADIQELPFPDASFDVVLANHMLYHVPDRPRALAEVRRVLVSGGAFHAATNGEGHLAELHELLPSWPFSQHVEDFGLETGPGQIEPFFGDVRVERFCDGLEVTEVEPVLAFIRSSFVYEGQDLDDAARRVAEAIARDGAFSVRKAAGLIGARKP